MRAAVHRHLDAKATFAGLTFPAEWMLVIGVTFIVAWAGLPTVGMGAGTAVYTAMRVAGAGQPEGHIQNWILWRLRQWWSAGRFTAAARASSPRFPYAVHVFRDAGRRTGA